MAAEKKKVYGNMRIIAIEGKDLYRTEALTALKNQDYPRAQQVLESLLALDQEESNGL